MYIDNIEFPFELNRNGEINPKEITFRQKALPKEYHDIAQGALINFPGELHNLESQEFGCPDCDDTGAIYLEINFQGTRKIWTIDGELTEPDYLVTYVQDLADIFKEVSAIK